MIKKFVLEYVLKTCWIKVLQNFFEFLILTSV